MFKVSYEIHTNKELELMLSGKKPLAIFYEDISFLPDENFIPESKFAPYVKNGQFIRAEELIEGPYSEKLARKIRIKNVLFSQTGEEWRIKAMLLLKREFYRTGEWNETCERMEGILLGYTEEENNEFCEKHYQKTVL